MFLTTHGIRHSYVPFSRETLGIFEETPLAHRFLFVRARVSVRRPSSVVRRSQPFFWDRTGVPKEKNRFAIGAVVSASRSRWNGIALRRVASTPRQRQRASSLRFAIEWSTCTSYALCYQRLGDVSSKHWNESDASVKKHLPPDGKRRSNPGGVEE